MKKIYSLLLFALVFSHIAQAQPATSNWRFGNQVGLVFPATGPPTAATGSALTSYEAGSSVSDGAGNLLCYTNAVQVWDRNNAPMPNGALSGSSASATQGALLLPKPGSTQEYYLFTVDAIENGLASGLRYSVVDMSLRGGLGDIGTVKDVAVALPGGLVQVTEKLTAIQLANGRDYWVIVHGWGTNRFYSFLLTPAGLQTMPVVSSVGLVHRGGGGPYNNAGGYLRASPAGTRLAVAQRDNGLELFDFDRATGAVTNAQTVSISAQYYYGLEFSADGSKLYMTDLVGQSVFQVDLSNSNAVVTIGIASNFTGGVLRGPDNRIYVGVDRSNYLAVIPTPDAAGTACGFQNNGAFLGTGVQTRIGLPNFPNSYAAVVNYWTGNVSIDYLLPGNWNAGYVPSATDDVTIPAAAVRMPILSGPVAHRAFAIESGASMTLAAGGTLILSADLTATGTLQGEGTLATNGAASQQLGGQPFTLGNLLVGAAGAALVTDVTLTQVLALIGNLDPAGRLLTLRSDANGTAMVVNNGTARVTGPATVQRYVGPAQYVGLGYRHVAAPVAGATVASLATPNFTPVFNPDYNTVGNTVTPFPTVYSYDQTRVTTPGATLADFDRGWFSPATAAVPLADATGYTLNMVAGETFAFRGLLHNGNFTRTGLGRGAGLQAGWHFLGNPYPAPISWTQAFAGATGLDDAVYVFQASGQYAGGYASFVNRVGLNGGGDEIALGRGFFVRTSSAATPGALALTNAARLTGYANPDFQRGAAETRPLLRLALQGRSGPADEAVAYLETGATPGFDRAFDAYKVAAGPCSLGFESGNELLGVNGLPPLGTTPVVLPLRVLANQPGSYTLVVRELLNLPAGTTAQLRDTHTGTLTLLTPHTSYAFVAPATAQTGRFFVLLNPARPGGGRPVPALADISLYPNPAHDQLWLSRPAALAGQALTVRLLNGLGQVVRQQTVAAAPAAAAVSLAGLPQGIYTVQVASASGRVSRRVAVQ